MILYRVTFGSISGIDRDKAEDYIEYYISALFHNGQACGEYFTVLQNAKLCTYLNIQDKEAILDKYHCKYGRKWLAKIESIFASKPVWQSIDDEIPEQDNTFKAAPFLYLYSQMNDWESPIHRGDNGLPIPLYLLEGEHEDRENVYFWQNEYRHTDSLWMASGGLELITYKQLAKPDSPLNVSGMELCQYVERVTGIPTYLYLMRYWGRRLGENNRTCPGCGNKWAVIENQQLESPAFHEFDFKCDDCRLVSHISSCNDDERHAVIGEWKKKKAIS